MNIVAVTAADGEAVLPLAAAKRHLKIEPRDPETEVGAEADAETAIEDVEISAFRDAAIDLIEQFTGRSLQRRAFRWSGVSFAQAAALPIRPVRSIVSVGYLIDDVVTPITTDHYRIVADGITALSASPWPSISWGADQVRVEFEAGYDVDLPLPPALLAAVKMLMAHLYRNREAGSVGAAVTEVPFGVGALCRPYRSWAMV